MTTSLTNRQVLELATELHGSQLRSSGDAYITHPIAVSLIAKDILEMCYPLHVQSMKDKIIQAAYLHDVLEDCEITEEGLLDQGVNPEVIQICALLDKNNYPDYFTYIQTVCELDLIGAAIVKYADLLHNSHNQKNKLKLDRYKLAMALLEQYYMPLKVNSKHIQRLINNLPKR